MTAAEGLRHKLVIHSPVDRGSFLLFSLSRCHRFSAGAQRSNVGMLPPSDSEEDEDEGGDEKPKESSKAASSSKSGQSKNAGKLPPSGSEDEDDDDESEEESSEEPLNEYLSSSAPRKK